MTILKSDRNKTAFIHLRVDPELKRDLEEFAKEKETSITAVVTRAIEKYLYEAEPNVSEEQDMLLDELTDSLENLQKYMDLRFTVLQDNLQILMNAILSQRYKTTSRLRKEARKSRLKKSKLEEVEEEELEEEIIEPLEEEEIAVTYERLLYDKVKAYMQELGTIPNATQVKAHLERTCKKCMQFLAREEQKSKGSMMFYLIDAIQEAASELGYST